ncbi:MAG: class I SAM-dependent methyltransferase [Planctomycetes bacterium]|nr:class I SAM-dependent methyltransferase [Planctomycetota bacterium]
MVALRRWRRAQVKELSEWLEPGTVEGEIDEFRRKYAAVFDELARVLSIGGATRILDVGCGPCGITSLWGTGRKVGIEPNVAGYAGIARWSDLRPVRAMGEALPFAAGAFDIAVCRNVIDHTLDPRAVIAEVRRVLRPGGALLLACYVHPRFVAAVKRAGEASRVFRNEAHPHVFTERSLDALGTSSGFRRVRAWTIHEGTHPTDYGKSGPPETDGNPLHRAVVLANRRLFANRWFVRERLLWLERLP